MQKERKPMSVWGERELPWLPRITTLASIVDAHDPYIVQWQEERWRETLLGGERRKRRKIKLCCGIPFFPVLHDSEIRVALITTTRCQ